MSRRHSQTRKNARSKRASGPPRQPKDGGARRPPSPRNVPRQDHSPSSHRRGRG